jgi:hypothetical protein
LHEVDEDRRCLGPYWLVMASCVGRRSINYLHDGSLSNTSKLFPNKKFQYRLQVNDVLSIRVLGLDDANAQASSTWRPPTGGLALNGRLVVRQWFFRGQERATCSCRPWARCIVQGHHRG